MAKREWKAWAVLSSGGTFEYAEASEKAARRVASPQQSVMAVCLLPHSEAARLRRIERAARDVLRLSPVSVMHPAPLNEAREALRVALDAAGRKS